MSAAPYFRPSSLAEALSYLSREGERCKVIAGCTDVLVKFTGLKRKTCYLDVSYLAELSYVWEEGDCLIVGALTTYTDLVESPLIRAHAPVLAQASFQVGSPQIRNRGTIGGNLVNASPAADGVPALMVHDGLVVIRSEGRTRQVNVADFATGPGMTVLRPDELVTEIRLAKGSSSDIYFFLKVGQRKAQTIAKASVTLRAEREKDGRLTGVNIALGSVAPTVIEASRAASLLEGNRLSEPLIFEAAEVASREARPIDDIRSTKEYRRELVRALMIKGLIPFVDHGGNP